MPGSSTEFAAVGRFDNIHLGLSQEEALRILTLPEEQLESASDYYMAASHLINFPGGATEAALIGLVVDGGDQQSKRLARRKAVEVLGRLKVQEALPAITACLDSDDAYLVENTAWALEQLGCDDPGVHQRLIDLLGDEQQNRRVLIQSLASLGIEEALPSIRTLLNDPVPGVRGAALAAVARLSGRLDQVSALEDHLTLPNQMDRQSAIQDVIDCCAGQLLPSVLKAPVSPVFRMRAFKALWPESASRYQNLELLETLDRLLLDDPDHLVLVHRYDDQPDDAFLIQEFFGTDFSRCYLALQTLRSRPPMLIWPLLRMRWQQEAHNDYGAHYFFIRLFGTIQFWPEDAKEVLQEWLLEAVETQRPQFMKSKPAAILALAALSPDVCALHLMRWLDPQQMPFWEARYAAAMAAMSLKMTCSLDPDPNPYVQARRVGSGADF